jgi:hypothetical protein
MSQRIALACGLALSIVAIGVVLTRSPPVVARTNGVPIGQAVASAAQKFEDCQKGEALPGGTTAIRLWLAAGLGPRVQLRVIRDGVVLTRGEQPPGWSRLTVAVKPLEHAVAGVSVCFAMAPKDEVVFFKGVKARGAQFGARIRIEYLRPGSHSWLSLAPSIAKRMSLGREPSTIWIVLAVLAGMLALVAIVAATVLHPTRVALCVALAAALNAACWSVVTPPFQVGDEPSHFAYVKQVAETGTPPQSVEGALSSEEAIALGALHFVPPGRPGLATIATQSEQNAMSRELALAATLPRDGSKSAAVATAEPPLYYAVEAIPYLIAYHGTLLDRLQLMRLLSALMAGLTALFVFLFVREALPSAPWAWTVAGLGVAVTPLLGFMSGAVNPDAMLYAVSAALFFCFARAFRRGLTRRLAVGIGAAIALGLLTKLNFVGLLPGAIVGLAILVRRIWRTSRREACARAVLAGVAATAPVAVAVATGAVRTHAGPDFLSSNLTGFFGRGSFVAKLSYIWQLYLPRLPGMASDFPGISPARQIWLKGFVGQFGWGEVVFPGWVVSVALIPVAVIVGLFIRAVYGRRAALRGRAAESCVYALIAAGVLMMVAWASYKSFPETEASFGQTRYLFPMLALLGALLALAARGAGRRWGSAVGVLIVVLMLDHDIFSQLLVVAHYYGPGGPPVV